MKETIESRILKAQTENRDEGDLIQEQETQTKEGGTDLGSQTCVSYPDSPSTGMSGQFWVQISSEIIQATQTSYHICVTIL